MALDRNLALQILFTGIGTGAKTALYSLGQSGNAVMVTPLEAHHFGSQMVDGLLADPLQRLALEQMVDALLNGRPSPTPVDAVIPPTDGGGQ